MAVFTSACFGAPEESEPEQTELISDPVVGGVSDHTNIHHYVGEYSWDTGSRCSGILVTPAWVLTANHCVMGSLDANYCGLSATGVPLNKIDHDLTISFAANGLDTAHAGINSPLVARHTHEISGDVRVRVNRPIDQCNNNDVAKDLALFQLDRRIPMEFAQPLHPPGIGPEPGPSCNDGSSFTATLVGFGGDHLYRAYLSSSGWKRHSQSGGAIYRNSWFAFGGKEGSSEPGDSGGALLRNGALCAVTSGRSGGVEWRGWGPVGTLVPVVYTNTAAVDSNEAVEFISHILDNDGRYMGECLPGEGPSHLRDVDTDGDLLPDACDPCPDVADEEYRRTGEVIVWTDPRTGGTFGPGCCPPIYRTLPGYDPIFETLDSDEDGIPDLCDSCPYLENLEQLDGVEDDLDGDGIPDKCDNCPGVASVRPDVHKLLMPLYPEPDSDGDLVGDMCDWCTSPAPEDRVFEQELANCNMEAELAIYYPGRTTVPIIREGPNYESELATYQEAFKIGTCDVACPVIKLEDGIFPEGQYPEFPCVTPGPGECGFVMRNGISHYPKPSPTTVNGVATTHTKWCDCDLVDVEDRAGRAKCILESGCQPLRDQFDLDHWRELKTASSSTPGGIPDWSTAGPEVLTLTFEDLYQGTTLWDYVALGAPFVKSRHTGQDFDPATDDFLDAYVNGVLWSNIRNGFGTPSGSQDEVNLQERGSFLETGAADAKIKMRHHILDVPLIIDPEIEIPCYECGIHTDMNKAHLFVVSPGPDELGRMELVVTPQGIRDARGLLTASTREALHSIHALDQRIVAASEPLGTLEQKRPGQPGLRGVIVSSALGIPVTSLITSGLHGSIDTYPLTDVVIERSVAPGPLTSEEGLVLSGERQELYRFGGSFTGSSSVWTYHLPSHSWTKTPLPPGKSPGRVLAATYRHQDSAVYEVDRGALLLTRLRRWVPGDSRFETLAMWPSPWRSFTRYWLVNGPKGELFFIGSRNNLSVIAKFVPNAAGVLRFGGVRLLHEAIHAKPVASHEHIGYVVRVPGDTLDGGGAQQKQLPISSIGRWLADWCPYTGDK